MIAPATPGAVTKPSTNRVDIAIGALAAIATLAAMLANVPLLLLGAVLGCLLLAVVRPLAGLAALAILLPLRQPEVLHPPGPTFLLIAALGFGSLLRLPFEARRPKIGAGLWLLVLYLVLGAVTLPGFLSGGRPVEQEYVLYLFEQLLGVAATFVIARYLLQSVDNTPYLLLLLSAAAIAGTLAIIQWWWGGPDGIPLRALMSPAPDAEWSDRVRGPFFNTNYFGFFLATSIVFGASVIGRLPRGARFLPMVFSGVAAIALALTFSRGATLSLIVGLLTLAWFRSRRLAISLALTAGLLVAVAYPIFLNTRASGSGNELPSGLAAEQDNVELRGSILVTGVQIFLSEPVFGVGYGRFTFESPWFERSLLVTEPHNSYTQVLAEQGMLGALAALGCVAALALGIRRAGRRFGAGAAALLATVLADGLFLAVTSSMQATGLAAFALGAMLAAAAAERQHVPEHIPAEQRVVDGLRARRPSAVVAP